MARELAFDNNRECVVICRKNNCSHALELLNSVDLSNDYLHYFKKTNQYNPKFQMNYYNMI